MMAPHGTVLTIVKAENPCTVFFDRPIPKAYYFGLISCLLCNLKTSRTILLLSPGDRVFPVIGFPPRHYTPRNLAKILNSVLKELKTEITAEANSSTGAVVIKNPQNAKLQFSQNLADFLGVTSLLETDAFISNLNAPSAFFVYCDLVDPDQNLLNRKKTTLLAKSDIRG